MLVQVNVAREAVQRGTTEYIHAKRYFKRSQRCMCIVIILVGIILAVIAIAVVLGLHPWSR